MNKSEINDYFEVCSIIYLYFINIYQTIKDKIGNSYLFIKIYLNKKI